MVDGCLNDGVLLEGQWTKFLVPEAMTKIRHLAIGGDDWFEMDPEEGMARLESGEDARVTVAEFTALETLSLVLVADFDDPYYDVSDDPFVDLTVDDWMEDDFEERRLVPSPAFHHGNDFLENDTRGLFEDLEKSRPGWTAPEVQLARIVR